MVPSNGLYFEEFQPGRTFQTSRRTVTETDLVNYVTLCGFFEPIFMDQPYVEDETPYQARIVPGALTLSFAEGLTLLSGIIHGTGMALLNLEMKVEKPVFVGDTIAVEIEVLAGRPTRHADRGIVTFQHRVRNQRGEMVMQYTVQRMLQRRPADGCGARPLNAEVTWKR